MKYRDNFITWYFNIFNKDPLYLEMCNTIENSPWHREQNTGVHTNMVVGQYLSTMPPEVDKMDALGALACAFHDVGKPPATVHKFKEDRGNYVSFPGHEQLSARLWEDYAIRNWELLQSLFDFTPYDIYRVGWMIEYHLPWDIKHPEKVSRLIQTCHVWNITIPFLKVLMADCQGRIADNMEENVGRAQSWIMNFKEMYDTHVQTYVKSDKTIFLAIGASGSGKSTMLAKLRQANNIEHYSWDEFRLQWYFMNDYEQSWKASCDDPNFKNRCQQEFMHLLNRGVNIYVDNINVGKKSRNFFITEARKKGYKVVAILFPVDVQTIIDRQITRGDKKLAPEVVKQQYEAIQLPCIGEFDDIIMHYTTI